MADPDMVVITPSPRADPSRSDLYARLNIVMSQVEAAYERAWELLQRAECALAENRVLRQAIKEAIRGSQSAGPRQEPPEQSEYARMVTRMQTMPVIEQAKGIIMAESRCGEAEAFDMLRRASQRSNVPVRELAARLVAKAADTVTVSGGVAGMCATQSLTRRW